MVIWLPTHKISLNPLRTLHIGNTVTKVGEITSPFMVIRPNSNKVNSDSPIITVNLRTTRIPDINHHITVSSLICRASPKIIRMSDINPHISDNNLPQPITLQLIMKSSNPNPKGGINAFNDKPKIKGETESSTDEEAEDSDDEEAEQRVYEILLEMIDSKDKEDEDIGEMLDCCEEYNSDYKEDKSDKEGETENESGEEYSDEFEDDEVESEEESDEEDKNKNSKVEDQDDKGKIFFINNFFRKEKVEEEIPAKSENPGPRKIRGVDIPDYLCDARACGNIGPHESYKTLDLGPRKKTGEVFHIIKSTEGEKKSAHQLQADDGRMRGKDPLQRMEAEAKLREMLLEEKKEEEEGSTAEEEDEEEGKGFNEEAKKRVRGRSSKEKKKVVARAKESLRGKAPKEGGSSGSSPQRKGNKQKETSYPNKKKKKKKKEPDEGMDKRIQKKKEKGVDKDAKEERRNQKKGPDKVKEKHEIRSSNLVGILGKLKKILHHHKGAYAHLVRNKSKWK
ncbi:hypothetical protein PIB30_034807 [Stylosanthes scabra]|uniref:Uncharacterized protein n=1 Tax=Stylosanthes scabra TaxID=79078 RepID=A0ABU6UG83_9FABA|nr:hypothetical protein [Stylosanthes scabra]